MTILKKQSLIHNTIFSLLCLVLTGCGTTQPSRFYLLTSIEDTSSITPATQNPTDLHIGLGPVNFPKYLDRPSIVKQSTSSEIIIDEIHRWAEPLEDNFTRVLASNLYTLLNKATIATHPWRSWKDLDYQVIINVSRFDADINGNVILSAHWIIRSKADGHDLSSQKSMINEKAENNAYPALVRAQSKVTEKLSREIANELKEIIVQGHWDIH